MAHNTDDDVQFLGQSIDLSGEDFIDTAAHDGMTDAVPGQLPSSVRIGEHRIDGARLDFVEIGECIITVGATVEIQSEDGQGHTGFLRIGEIVSDSSTIPGITLAGDLFRRSTQFNIGHRKINEVTKVHTILSQAQSTADRIPFTKLLLRDGNPVFRDLVVTSDAYPTHNLPSTVPMDTAQIEDLKQNGRLVCRTIITNCHRSVTTKPFSGMIRYIRKSESDSGFSRGIPPEHGVTLNLTKAKRTRLPTYASGCCGCGGDMAGAKAAGCRLVFGWDHWITACKTNRRNHPEATIYCVNAVRALQVIEHHRVDILHLSWPCQYFSPMRAGRTSAGDDANSAAILGTAAHLRAFKPLYMTMENTAGLGAGSHKLFFKTVLSDIMSEGYNVAWMITNFTEFGLPASRKRLIIFASHKDAPMAKFPTATHGPGLQPFATVKDVLECIPEDSSHHLGTATIYASPRAPFDANSQMKCLLTSGGESHFSGLRTLSLRERATLQSFPTEFTFKGTKTEINRQIGNAVPPGPWAIFIGSIVDTLRKWRAGALEDDSIAQAHL